MFRGSAHWHFCQTRNAFEKENLKSHLLNQILSFLQSKTQIKSGFVMTPHSDQIKDTFFLKNKQVQQPKSAKSKLI